MGAALHPLSQCQISDGDGAPYIGSKFFSYIAGTVTPQSLYEDVDLTIALTNPVVSDGDGRFPDMFVLPIGYNFTAKTSADVVIYTQENWSDPGSVFAGTFGNAMVVGELLAPDGYLVTATDLFVTMSPPAATAYTLNLPSAATRTQPVYVKNRGAGTIVVTRNGSDTIEFSLTTYTIEAAATPLFPTVGLFPVTGGWAILSSHRAA